MKFGINALFVTIVTIAAVILINAVISAVSSKVPMKVDLTRERVYEFSEHTREVMKKIDKEINVYALYPNNTSSNEYISYAEEYLAKYSALNKNFKVTYIDPYSNPNFAKKYETQGETINAGSIILECGDRVKVVTMNQLYTTNNYTGSTSIDMEKKITAAVMNVTGQSGSTKVYFTEGHDEFSSNQLAAALEEDGYEHETLNIAMNGIPEDAALLILMSPEKDLTAEERDALDKYLDGGGKALFVLEPGTQAQPRIAEYLAEWGITARGDYVVEGDSNHAYKLQNGMTIPVPEFAEHEITESLSRQKLVYMAVASESLELNSKNVRNALVTPLLTTTEKSWGKVNLEAGTTEREEGDNEGPLTIAALSETQGANYGKIMVLGSLYAVEMNGILSESSYANGDFILNSVSYLTGADTSLDIRAKVISASSLTMSQTQVVITWVLLQYVLPLLIIAAGLAVWLKRRYK